MFMITYPELAGKKIHLIGISGTGMVGIAQFLLSIPEIILSGSDLNITHATKKLIEQGVLFYETHHKKNIEQVDIVVISGAIPDHNEELIEAKKFQKKIYHRAQFLKILMEPFKSKIGVAGTHGKTTSSGMLISIIQAFSGSSSYIIGGENKQTKQNGQFGESDIFIAEADESDGSFLIYNFSDAIITNVEKEHMNFFKTKEKLYFLFETFMNKIVSKNGMLILNIDDPWLSSQQELFNKPNVFTISIFKEGTCTAKNISYTQKGSSFDLFVRGVFIERFHGNFFGLHNIYNALGVICLSLNYQIPIDKVLEGIRGYHGIKRRMELKEQVGTISIYDDYAHHPTEIATTLQGLKLAFHRRIICIFQPHRFSRTKHLMNDFLKAFQMADVTIITEIYSANEVSEDPFSAKLIVNEILKSGQKKVFFIAKLKNIAKKISLLVNENDIIITMGAGNISTIAKSIATQIQLKSKELKNTIKV